MEKEPKFLIVRLSAIGDIVHSLTVADCLRTFYPKARIDWVVGDKCFGILKGNPLLNNIYVAEVSKWRKNWLLNIGEILKFGRVLKENEYDYVIDVQGLFKSAVITALSGGKERIGLADGREFSTLVLTKKVQPIETRPFKNRSIIRRNLDILEGSGLISKEQMENYMPKACLAPSSDETKKKVGMLLEGVEKTLPNFVYAPATTWENKHWPWEEWKKLYDLTKDKANIIFTGIEKDLELINKITGGAPYEKTFILAGKTNMEEYIEVLRNADLIISPDSGASHLGFAVIQNNRPKIFTLFFATSKKVYAPVGEFNRAFPLKEQVCSPCHKRKCKKGDMKCLKAFKAEDVFEEIQKIFNL